MLKNHCRGLWVVPINAFYSEKTGLQHIKKLALELHNWNFDITFSKIDCDFDNVKNWTIFSITFFLEVINISV